MSAQDAHGSEAPGGRLCPYCGAPHAQDENVCERCGAALTRRCPYCDAINWIRAERCAECGAALDMLAWITQRELQGTSGRLYRQMERGGHLKQQEMAASQARLERMQAQERERQAAIRRRRAEQRARERQMLTVAAVTLGVLILIFVVLLIITLL